MHELLLFFTQHLNIAPSVEITLETNPGATNNNLTHFVQAGINRVSLGVQSFNDLHLKTIGRIHSVPEIYTAIQTLSTVRCLVNLDLMYGLPNQTISEALDDLKQAIACKPHHLSWYNLTLEENTIFHKMQPQLPPDDHIYAMQQQGCKLLQKNNLLQYEVSAFSLPDKQCVHNLNYWTFGDYLGIGAGAHSKITNVHHQVRRFAKAKIPRSYMQNISPIDQQVIDQKNLIFEFMLNATRLRYGFSKELFSSRTGLQISTIETMLNTCKKRKLLSVTKNLIHPTKLGFKFLNNLQTLFL